MRHTRISQPQIDGVPSIWLDQGPNVAFPLPGEPFAIGIRLAGDATFGISPY